MGPVDWFLSKRQSSKNEMNIGKMSRKVVQQVKMSAAKPDNLHSVPRTCLREGENWFLQIVLGPAHMHTRIHTMCLYKHTYAHKHTHKQTHMHALTHTHTSIS